MSPHSRTLSRWLGAPTAPAAMAPLAALPMILLAFLAGRALAGSWLVGQGPTSALLWGSAPLLFAAVSARLALRARGSSRALALGAAFACLIAFFAGWGLGPELRPW